MLAHLETLVDGARILQIRWQRVEVPAELGQSGGHLLVLVGYSGTFAERPADRMLSDCLRDNRRILQIARRPAEAADCRSIGIGSILPPDDVPVQALFVDVPLDNSDCDSSTPLRTGSMFVSSEVPQIERLLAEMGSA